MYRYTKDIFRWVNLPGNILTNVGKTLMELMAYKRAKLEYAQMGFNWVGWVL